MCRLWTVYVNDYTYYWIIGHINVGIHEVGHIVFGVLAIKRSMFYDEHFYNSYFPLFLSVFLDIENNHLQLSYVACDLQQTCFISHNICMMQQD